MNYGVVSVLACLGLFLGMVVIYRGGYRLGRLKLSKEDAALETTGPVIAAIFALLGLLIAFTFSGAYSRFDARRQLIIQEANAIGTAYLRLDLLPADAQAPLREKFRRYVASRAELYRKLKDVSAALRELAKGTEIEKEIWTQAVAASSGPEYQSTRMLLIPAVNEMIDIVTSRVAAMQTHPPMLVFIALSIIALLCAGMTGCLAGIGEHPSNLYNITFAAVIAFILYVILDIDHPRYGFVRLDQVNQMLIEMGKMMK